MEGILHETQNQFEYCRQLIFEYTILDSAQLFSILKQYGQFSKRGRERIIKELRLRGIAKRFTYGDRSYHAQNPQIQPKGKYMAQIRCFWILLQYINKVDSHSATGTFSRITMEIEGRDYDIVYVPIGAERMCMSHMQRGGDTRYFVIVADEKQIPKITGNRIHTFATVSDKGEVKYFDAKNSHEIGSFSTYQDE